MNEQEFNNAIENNRGYELIYFCHDKLTEKQIDFIKNKK